MSFSLATYIVPLVAGGFDSRMRAAEATKRAFR